MKESDNNVKLIVLDRLIALKEISSHKKVLQVIVSVLFLVLLINLSIISSTRN